MQAHKVTRESKSESGREKKILKIMERKVENSNIATASNSNTANTGPSKLTI